MNAISQLGAWSAAALALSFMPISACAHLPHSENTHHILNLSGTWKVQIDEADVGLGAEWFRQPLVNPVEVDLPGSLAQNKLGHRFDPVTGDYDGLNPPYLKWPSAGYTDDHRRDDLGVLVADHMTFGPAWFERSIEIPAAWDDRNMRISLERVKWASQLWVDGKQVSGLGARSLHTPHIYDLGSLSAGQHRLTLRIDNRPQVNMGFAGHGYGMETESLWLGAVGGLKLTALDPQRVERVVVRPSKDWESVEVDLELAGDIEFSPNADSAPNANSSSNASLQPNAELTISLFDPAAGDELGKMSHSLTKKDFARTLTLQIPLMHAAEGWDEFSPKLYELRWEIVSADQIIHKGMRRVGLRTFEREGRHILLNGAPIFLRGNLDCAIHPDSHTPPTDREWWQRVLEIHKESGFNHIRFHTWCPPEIAFDVADELGIYLQVETAYWVDDWIHATDPQPHAIGENAAVDQWVEEESMRIIRQFEHHPSFAMFSLGNEFGMTQTDWGKMQEITARLNAASDHVLVSGTPARKSLQADEFWVTHTTGKGTRGFGPAYTDWDFSSAVQMTEKPVIAHETGQRPSWPDYDRLLPKFEGVMQPWNLKRLRANAKAAGLKDHLRRAEASAKFAMVQYKSECEAQRRTADMAGYQLLMLHDFTGQGEAHVGLLDAFYDEKPGITLEEIRAWNGPTLPLARFKSYTWSTDQILEVQFQVAHEGPHTLSEITAQWQLTSLVNNSPVDVIASGTLPIQDIPDHQLTDLGAIQVPLSGLSKATAMRLTLRVGEVENTWNLRAYPPANSTDQVQADTPTPTDNLAQADLRSPTDTSFESKIASANLHLTKHFDRTAQQELQEGCTVILFSHGSQLPTSRKISWGSTYWTGAWGWGNGMGLLVDPNHPALAGFPTSTHSDWQWNELIQGGQTIQLPTEILHLIDDQDIVVENLADFHNPAREACIFAVKVGDGKLIVCGLDLHNNLENRHAARAMRQSLLRWAASEECEPKSKLSLKQASELLRNPEFDSGNIRSIESDSAQADHGPENVLDGNPATIWHTGWGAIEPPHPHFLSLDLGEPRAIIGLNLLPRQDGKNGLFKEIAIFISPDGQSWETPIHTQTLSGKNRLERVRFDPITTRFLKLEVRSEIAGRAWASLAELEVVEAAPKYKQPSAPFVHGLLAFLYSCAGH